MVVEDNQITYYAVVPTARNPINGRPIIEKNKLWKLIQTIPPVDKIYLENIAGRPGTGAAAMLNFGAGWGMIQGMLTAAGLKYILVTPQVWKPAMLTPTVGNRYKKQYTEYGRAKELFPDFNFYITKRLKNPHSGIVDAALIAAYGAMKNQ